MGDVIRIGNGGGGGGGGTTPGGGDTEIQYNSSNTFAGSANLTWDTSIPGMGIGPNSVAGGNYLTTWLAQSFPTLVDIENTTTVFDSGVTGNWSTNVAIGTLVNASADSDMLYRGVWSELQLTGSHNYTRTEDSTAGNFQFDFNGSGTFAGQGTGVLGQAYIDSSGAASGYIIGVYGEAGSFGSGPIALLWAVNGGLNTGGSSTITEFASLHADSPYSAGTDTITNLYQLKLANAAVFGGGPAATNAWAIWTGTGLVHFGDNVELTNGTALQGETTSGHTYLFNVYDTNTGPGYVTWMTATAGNTPSVVIAPPAGGTTVEIQATTYKSSDGSTGATGSANATNTLTIKNGLVVAIA